MADSFSLSHPRKMRMRLPASRKLSIASIPLKRLRDCCQQLASAISRCFESPSGREIPSSPSPIADSSRVSLDLASVQSSRLCYRAKFGHQVSMSFGLTGADLLLLG